MRSHLHAAATLAMLMGPAVMVAGAQNIYNQTNGQPGLVPGQGLFGPTISPRNLLVPGASAYPWAQNVLNAQSQTRYNQQIGQLQNQTGINASNIAGLQQDQQSLLLGGLTGHPVFFNNYRQYFLNLNARLPVGGTGGAGLGAGGLAALGGQDAYGLGAGGSFGTLGGNFGAGLGGASQQFGSARGGSGRAKLR